MLTIKLRSFLTTTIILLVIPPGLAIGKVIYVDGDARGTSNGYSWANAYVCLQDALVDARSGDEIWVAQGIHKPDQHLVRTGRPQVRSSGD
jgi:hypothetical protein